MQYTTDLGASVVSTSETILSGLAGQDLREQVQLVFTSPPFPLNNKKRYGNKQGEAYKEWLKEFAPLLREVLRPDGSIVVEVGNAWEPGLPVMSTLAIESLLAFRDAADLYLCQEFIWHNPAKLPTPAQWVTVERIRVKDSFTRLWWLSPNPKPKADNQRVLVPYSRSMKSLLKNQKYNAGKRPSEHSIGESSFLSDNGGAIPPNVIKAEHLPDSVLVGSNTRNNDPYQQYCKEHGLTPHPARMPSELAEFFINLCSEEGDLVLDPFAGSNTTGAVAEGLGRKWISIEANESYAASGVGRFTGLTRARLTAEIELFQA
ncbi:MAG TPA: site-specific DNA-methyltransferase [Longimicrobium sp.]